MRRGSSLKAPSCRPNSRNKLCRSHRLLLTGVAVSSSSFLGAPPMSRSKAAYQVLPTLR